MRRESSKRARTATSDRPSHLLRRRHSLTHSLHCCAPALACTLSLTASPSYVHPPGLPAPASTSLQHAARLSRGGFLLPQAMPPRPPESGQGRTPCVPCQACFLSLPGLFLCFSRGRQGMFSIACHPCLALHTDMYVDGSILGTSTYMHDSIQIGTYIYTHVHNTRKTWYIKHPSLPTIKHSSRRCSTQQTLHLTSFVPPCCLLSSALPYPILLNPTLAYTVP